MKNYIVKSLREFDDYEGLECISTNHCEKRAKNDIFNCTKERYEYLNSKGAVALKGIEKIEDTKIKKPTKKK